MFGKEGNCVSDLFINLGQTVDFKSEANANATQKRPSNWRCSYLHLVFFRAGLRHNPPLLLPEHRGAERLQAQSAPLAGQQELEQERQRRRRGGGTRRTGRIPEARQRQHKEELSQNVKNFSDTLDKRTCARLSQG